MVILRWLAKGEVPHPVHYCVRAGICLLWNASDVKVIRSLAAWKKKKRQAPYRRVRGSCHSLFDAEHTRGRSCDKSCHLCMPQYFDIFKISQDGKAIWVETGATMEIAMARVNTLRESAAADYMILSQSTGKRIVITAQGGIKRD